MISSAEELAEITALAEEAGAKFVWIGLHREAGELKWVTGESVDFYAWGSGEPSVTDSEVKNLFPCCSMFYILSPWFSEG